MRDGYTADQIAAGEKIRLEPINQALARWAAFTFLTARANVTDEELRELARVIHGKQRHSLDRVCGENPIFLSGIRKVREAMSKDQNLMKEYGW